MDPKRFVGSPTFLKNSIAEHGAMIVEGENGPDAIRFANGAGIAFRWPANTNDDAPQLLVAARVAAAVAKTYGEIKRINDDADHTSEWKAREIAKAIERGAATFAAEKANADKMIDAFDATDRAEAVPPQLAATDYNGGLIDAEIRAHVRSLDNAGHAQRARTARRQAAANAHGAFAFPDCTARRYCGRRRTGMAGHRCEG